MHAKAAEDQCIANFQPFTSEMKPAVSILVLALFVACSATEEKKTEKRGVLGLGYGLSSSLPLYGHGYYGGLSPYSGYYGHGVYSSSLYGHGSYGHGLYGHGLYGGHSLVAAPLVSKTVAAPLHYSSPWLGHGYWH